MYWSLFILFPFINALQEEYTEGQSLSEVFSNFIIVCVATNIISGSPLNIIRTSNSIYIIFGLLIGFWLGFSFESLWLFGILELGTIFFFLLLQNSPKRLAFLNYVDIDRVLKFLIGVSFWIPNLLSIGTIFRLLFSLIIYGVIIAVVKVNFITKKDEEKWETDHVRILREVIFNQRSELIGCIGMMISFFLFFPPSMITKSFVVVGSHAFLWEINRFSQTQKSLLPVSLVFLANDFIPIGLLTLIGLTIFTFYYAKGEAATLRTPTELQQLFIKMTQVHFGQIQHLMDDEFSPLISTIVAKVTNGIDVDCLKGLKSLKLQSVLILPNILGFVIAFYLRFLSSDMVATFLEIIFILGLLTWKLFREKFTKTFKDYASETYAIQDLIGTTNSCVNGFFIFVVFESLLFGTALGFHTSMIRNIFYIWGTLTKAIILLFIFCGFYLIALLVFPTATLELWTVTTDEDLPTEAQEISLNDPWLLSRIVDPVKGINCRHVECFDRKIAIRRDEKNCPFCCCTITKYDLVTDRWFKENLLDKTSPNCRGVKCSKNSIEEIQEDTEYVEDTLTDINK